MTRQLVVLADKATLSLSADRRKIGPWGVFGGHAAGTSDCVVISQNGTRKRLPSKVTTTVNRGDRIIITTPGGGGWGSPLKRKKESIERDVREGFVCRARAKRVYGFPRR